MLHFHQPQHCHKYMLGYENFVNSSVHIIGGIVDIAGSHKNAYEVASFISQEEAYGSERLLGCCAGSRTRGFACLRGCSSL